MTDQLALFDLEQLLATIEPPPASDLRDHRRRGDGAQRLPRVLVRRGLRPEHVRAAAALVLCLDALPTEGTDAR